MSNPAVVQPGRCPLSDVRCPENRPTSVDALYDDSSDIRHPTSDNGREGAADLSKVNGVLYIEGANDLTNWTVTEIDLGKDATFTEGKATFEV